MTASLGEWMAAVALVVGAARYARARIWLTADGARAAGGVGIAGFGAAGWPALGVLAVLLVSASLLTRTRLDRAVQADAARGRTARQVIAVSVVPTLALLAQRATAAPGLAACALAALSATAADTWAVEIGRRSRRPPVMITTLAPVPAGRSGAVSALGTLGAAAGAGVIAGAGALLGLVSGACVPAVATIGFLGAALDSLAGALLQAAWRCELCGDVREVEGACHGRPMRRLRGRPWIDNEMVNLLTSLSAALAWLAWDGWGYGAGLGR